MHSLPLLSIKQLRTKKSYKELSMLLRSKRNMKNDKLKNTRIIFFEENLIE